MTNSDRRAFTLVVLGRPGQAARRYRLRRSTIGALTIVALGIPCASAALGYVLGSRDTAHAAEAAPTSERADESTGAAAALALTAPPEAQAPIDHAEVAPAPAAAAAQADSATRHETETAQQADQAAVQPEAPDEAEAMGEPLRILSDAQSQDEIVIHPFAPDGSVRASDFATLEAAMACSGGRSQRPDAALVRLLLAAQQNFTNKPLIVLGGRCASHDDHADAESFHRSGRGIDIRIRGVSTERLMAWLVERGSGAAGRYKRAGFVHVDVRPGAPMHWEAEERRAQPKRARPSASQGATREEPAESDESDTEEPAPAEPAAGDDAPSPDTDSPETRAPTPQRELEVAAQDEAAPSEP